MSGDKITVDVEGDTFYSIRFDSVTSSSSSSSSTSSSGKTSSSGGTAAADACSKGDGFCTDTLQCDNGHWIVRSDDPAKCTTVENVESCKEGDGYCTETLQCENDHWVPRDGDPSKCTSGPGA